jgi:hypothetical protein
MERGIRRNEKNKPILLLFTKKRHFASEIHLLLRTATAKRGLSDGRPEAMTDRTLARLPD